MIPNHLILMLFVISATICYTIARKRNASTPFWVVMGSLLGPLAIPMALRARPITAR